MSTTPDEEQEFLAPADDSGWHWTTMRDWIAVCPDISATAIRLYWIVRSIMHEKGDKSRRLSIDHLCWLMPGINDKPCSPTRIKDALRELEQAGLLSNPDETVTRQWVTNATTGKRTKENFRRWRIHDLAPAGYGGWRSAIAKLAAYPGAGWQDTEGRKSDSQQTTSPPPAKMQRSAAHAEGRISAQSGRKSDQPRRKSGDSKALTCEDSPSKESFQANPLTNQPPVIGEADGEDHADAGWLDGTPVEPAAPSAGVRFLAQLPAICRPDSRAVPRLAPLVETLLARGEWTWDTLLRRLTAGIESAGTPPGALIRRLEKLVDEAQAQKGAKSDRPAWCGECDEHTRQRENDEGLPYRCPKCNPRAVSA